ncbi:TB2/DP1, HVA22 family-domain-containing protein [Mycena metata]|uniref:Protein YOP1 n=1 Tax=Mycena metata TaxID=1033252 RepID=A0AAD7DZG6_9AGAR|nr:TB2/DP1, HVA22 family-domain-containing protein [Mycena metata]KAJ7757112.1 TB2/DP1, HVA22 family-domain-containing protein [Mycena metata]
MLFYLTSRLVSSVAAFLYPGYASYKTLSQRPASEEDLERWLMYWSVLGCIVGVEYVAEWVISWIPLYYPIKTLLLLYLALPQTRGSTYIYTNHLQPFFRTHESQIDSLLAQLRVYIYQQLQKWVRLLWEHIGASMGQQPLESQASGYPDGAAPPPPQPNGLSGVVGSLWRSYGPGILANGAALLRPVPATGPQRAPITMNSAAGIPPSSMFYPGADAAGATQSILERRRQLEAELAALPHVPSSLSSLALPVTPGSAPLTPGASSSTTYSRNSSGTDLTNRGPPRERRDSFGGRFEEVEVPSDGEGYDVRDNNDGRPAPAARGSSWFGWGGGGSKGYDSVKND